MRERERERERERIQLSHSPVSTEHYEHRWGASRETEAVLLDRVEGCESFRHAKRTFKREREREREREGERERREKERETWNAPY